MPNIKLMESSLPIAPLNIARTWQVVLISERKVNDYIVSFRQNTLTENHTSPLFRAYSTDNYLIDCDCPRFRHCEIQGTSW